MSAGRGGALAVAAVGLSATVQDLGRHGHLAQGVGVSGAADRASAALANRLVANRPEAAVIEALFGGLAVRALDAAELAVTGADCPLEIHDPATGRTRTAALNAVIELGEGQTLRLRAPRTGVRAYLAVHGGIAVDPVLGSRSYDTLAGLGPAPLVPGAVLPIGGLDAGFPVVDAVAAPPVGAGGRPVLLEALLGPRDDWFTAAALARLAAEPFTVTPDSDRVGVRLEGAAPLERARTDELPSEPVAHGSVQVPAAGHPIVFLPDHPVTGGYPVVAVLTRAALDRAAQLAPGDTVRFRLR